MLDNKDLTILELLESNARTSYMEIARQLKLSEAAIRKRIKKLESQNVILGYKAEVNYKKLGYSNRVVMGVDTNPKDYFKVLNILKEIDFVKNLSTSSGDHMIMFEVWVKGMDELEKYLEKINSIGGVTASCPSILHESLK